MTNFNPSNVDAKVWAKAFCKITGFSDEEAMTAWFANAICAGADFEKKRLFTSLQNSYFDGFQMARNLACDFSYKYNLQKLDEEEAEEEAKLMYAFLSKKQEELGKDGIF